MSSGNEEGGEFGDDLALQITPDDIVATKKLARECVRQKYNGR